MNTTASNAAARLFEVGGKDHIALECGQRQITYGELEQSVARAGDAWQKLGMAPDERVAILAPDGIDWVIAYLGAIWGGGVAVGINPRLTMADFAPILTESDIRYVWTTPELAPQVAALVRPLPHPPRIISQVALRGSGTRLDWNDLMQTATPIAATTRADDDMALWIGTSGTTGTPKGVVHTHDVTAPCGEFARLILGAGAQDRFYATSKLFFAYALANSLFAGLRLGATVILDPEWPTAGHVVDMVRKHHPTLLFCVPTLYHKMLQEGVAVELADSSIRHFISAGEALVPRIRSGWLTHTGKAPISGYGTSETLCLMLYSDTPCGHLHPTPLTTVAYGEHTASMPQRVWFQHPAIARGYWMRPRENAEDFRDRCFSPGDMFLRHPQADGGVELEFTGRNDDMLKIAGQWVSTQWVEQALMAAGGEVLEEVAVVGVMSDNGLTAIAAFAVAMPGRRDEAERRLEAGITALPVHKRPRWVHWLDALPHTATGKLQRSGLGNLHQQHRPPHAHQPANGNAAAPQETHP